MNATYEHLWSNAIWQNQLNWCMPQHVCMPCNTEKYPELLKSMDKWCEASRQCTWNLWLGIPLVNDPQPTCPGTPSFTFKMFTIAFGGFNGGTNLGHLGSSLIRSGFQTQACNTYKIDMSHNRALQYIIAIVIINFSVGC